MLKKDEFLLCPCGNEINKDFLSKQKICDNFQIAVTEFENPSSHPQYFFHCYTPEEKEKSFFDEAYLDIDYNAFQFPYPETVICDYRHIIFSQQNDAINFYQNYTKLEKIMYEIEIDHRKVWLVRFVNEIKPLLINNIDGFVSKDRLIMMAGALTNYIGLGTTIVPRFSGEIVLPETKNELNTVCQVICSLKSVREQCNICARMANKKIIYSENKISILKNQTPIYYNAENWCGLGQIAVPVFVNGRWIATAVAGGIANENLQFEDFENNLRTHNILESFKDELFHLERENPRMYEEYNCNSTIEEIYENFKEKFRNLEKIKIDNITIAKLKAKLVKGVKILQKNLEERYTTMSQRKIVQWLDKLSIEQKSAINNTISPNITFEVFHDLIYKNLIQKIADYGLYEKSFFLINEKNSRTSPDAETTFLVFSVNSVPKSIKIVNDSFYKQLFQYQTPMYWKPETEFEEQNNIVDKLELQVVEILNFLNENKSPNCGVIIPVIISEDDRRHGIIIFMDQKYPRPIYADFISEYSKVFCFSIMQYLSYNLKDLYETLTKLSKHRATQAFFDFLNHELGSVLGYWQSSAEWIAALLKDKPEQFEEKIILKSQDIRQQASYLQRLIAELAQMNILKEGSFIAKKNWVNFFDLLKNTVHLYTSNALKKKIEFKFGERLKCETRIDEGYFNRILGNLIQNAINYSFIDNEIQIYAEIDSQKNFLLYIVNYGVSIKPEWENNIFELGFRFPDAAKYASGTGYGLWLARKLIYAHGDGFSLNYLRNKEYSNKTTFVITIPYGDYKIVDRR